MSDDVLGTLLMRESLDHCVKCTICETFCPVSNVTPLFPGPKYVGPQAERFRVRDEPSPTGDVEVVVPQECLDAAATVEEATEVLRNGVGAVEDCDRQSILDMLNRLEDLEAQAREQADRCSDVDVNRPQ